MNNEKKLVAAFRNFVDKVFLPTLKKTDQQALEWGKFNAIIASPIINYQQLFQYVQSINNNTPNTTPPSTFQRRQIPPFKKPKFQGDGATSESGGFNPSKTFGGERARMMIMKGEDEFGEKKQNPNGFGFGNRFEDRGSRPFGNSGQNVLPGLESLCKTFLQNQQRIEGLLSSHSHVGTSPNTKYT